MDDRDQLDERSASRNGSESSAGARCWSAVLEPSAPFYWGRAHVNAEADAT
jgi:hypothetical protein